MDRLAAARALVGVFGDEARLADTPDPGHAHESVAVGRAGEREQLVVATDERCRCVALGPGARRPQQHAVLLQHCELESPELGTGLDPELVTEQSTDLLVRRECFGLAPVPVQRGHQLRPPALAQRFVGHRVAQAGDRVVGPPDVEQEVAEGLGERAVALLERADAVRDPVGVRIVAPRTAAPRTESRPRRVERPLGLDGSERVHLGPGVLVLLQVVGWGPHEVAGRGRAHRVGTTFVAHQGSAQPAHGHVHDLVGGRGRIRAPEPVDDPFDRNRDPGLGEEDPEDARRPADASGPGRSARRPGPRRRPRTAAPCEAESACR